MDVSASHPLMALRPHTICTWDEWRRLWDKSAYLEQFSSLLHCGFDVPAYHQSDTAAQRVQFYLEIADGHQYAFESGFREKSDTARADELEQLKTSARRRETLARKAFKVLAERFLATDQDGWGGAPSWTGVLSSAPALDKLLWFFRLDRNRLSCGDRDRLPNLQRNDSSRPDHATEVAKEFVLTLCRFGWRFPHDSRRHKAFVELLESRRPQLLELLCGIGRLGELKAFGTQWLDASCEAVLTQLAMRPRWLPNLEDTHGNGTRPPRSLEEAAAFGSKPAEILLLLQNRRIQERNLTALQEAQAELRAAQKRANALQAPQDD